MTASSKNSGLCPEFSPPHWLSRLVLTGEYWIDGVNPVDQPSNGVLANYRWIGPDYFTTIQQHILEGRALDEQDRNAKQRSHLRGDRQGRLAWPKRY